MRREILKVLAGAAFAAALPVAAAPPRKTDQRLLGTWRSDRERTTRLWKYKNDLDAETKQRFENFFGKLTRRFTATRSYSDYDGDKTSQRYWVVASDEQSVVIGYPEGGGVRLEQIFFEENWIYILSGYNVEFFRRVEV